MPGQGTAKSDWTVPFDRAGDMMSWESWRDQSDTRWAADYEWDDTLEYVTYSRGRSSVTVKLRGRGGRMFTMFLAEFMRCVPQMDKGSITGRWGFTKRGDSYGILLVG